MPDIEILTHKGLDIFSDNKVFIIEALNNVSMSKLNFSNKSYLLEKLKDNLDDTEFKNFNYILESRLFTGIQVAVPIAANTPKYNMRARKASDNTFVYWRSTILDTSASQSGYPSGFLYDICFINYN